MSKPKRSSNFLKSEEEKLVKLVLEKKHIFENKKTDAVTSKQKDSAWERVAQQFSASPNNKKRTAKALKEKYNNIKRTIRRTTANNRRELFLTGGGPPPKQDKENINPVLDELSDVMGLSVDGLPSRQDDDNIFENIINQAAVTEYSEDIIEYEFLNDEKIDEDADISFNGADNHTIRKKDEMMVPPKDWGTYNPSMLRSKQNDLLKMPKNQNQKVAIGGIEILKKQILEQQYEHARLQHNQKIENFRIEHEQRIMQSAEEHKIKLKILETELHLKQMQVKMN